MYRIRALTTWMNALQMTHCFKHTHARTHMEAENSTSAKYRRTVHAHAQQIRDPATRQIPLRGRIDILVCANCRNTMIQMFPFYKLRSTSRTRRSEKERYFLKRFKTKLPSLPCIANCTNMKFICFAYANSIWKQWEKCTYVFHMQFIYTCSAKRLNSIWIIFLNA